MVTNAGCNGDDSPEEPETVNSTSECRVLHASASTFYTTVTLNFDLLAKKYVVFVSFPECVTAV